MQESAPVLFLQWSEALDEEHSSRVISFIEHPLCRRVGLDMTEPRSEVVNIAKLISYPNMPDEQIIE